MNKANIERWLSPERRRTSRWTSRVSITLVAISYLAYRISNNRSFGGEVGLILVAVWVFWIAYTVLTRKTDYQLLRQQLREDRQEADNILKSVGVDPNRKTRG